MALKIVFKKDITKKNLCLGVFEGNKFPTPTQVWDKKLKGLIETSLKNSNFKGKLNQALTLYSPEGLQITLIGLGKASDQNEKQWQQIGASLLPALQASPSGECDVELHGLGKEDDAEVTAQIAFGALLKSWRFEKYFTTKKEEKVLKAKEVTFVLPAFKETQKKFEALSKLAEGIFLTRTLVSEPSNVMLPDVLAKMAAGLKSDGVKVEVYGKKELKKMGMNALLGVGQGSVQDSKVVVMQWNGGDKKDAPLAFIGKGVTFDTGGISLKPALGMEEMKCDMAGAAVVIGLMKTLALRKAKVNAIGVVGIVENMPSGEAQRPGDVVTSLSGQTIEVLNTDAEGRLVLADVLWYAQDRFKPKLMIDLATLTGAIIIALGTQRAGLFTPDKKLSKDLMDAGDKVNELLWPFPLDDSYDKDIDSLTADMKNIGNGRNAGSIAGAKFLQRFTNNTPWAHLDIAGVAWAPKDTSLCAQGATGFGVRLLDQFVKDGYEK